MASTPLERGPEGGRADVPIVRAARAARRGPCATRSSVVVDALARDPPPKARRPVPISSPRCLPTSNRSSPSAGANSPRPPPIEGTGSMSARWRPSGRTARRGPARSSFGRSTGPSARFARTPISAARRWRKSRGRRGSRGTSTRPNGRSSCVSSAPRASSRRARSRTSPGSRAPSRVAAATSRPPRRATHATRRHRISPRKCATVGRPKRRPHPGA